MFEKVLIANRGEIAVRVIQACREMGLATVAVYSDADRNAMHVRLADEARHVGPPAPRESYLNARRIVQAAVESGADAIHPGYGFLSENAAFARAAAEAGVAFIGPKPEVIATMGNKGAARDAMVRASIPVVPGFHAEGRTTQELLTEAERIGFPVMIKAVAGGGGKGMRLVTEPEKFLDAAAAAEREALSAFGDGTVYVEKFIVDPRHVEVQVVGDAYGTVLHFFERECSIQRRHQKMVEESPSTALSDGLRARMCAAALQAAEAVGYTSLGTFEFLLDPEGRFYFLEMNTRLQVEHAITEFVTGVDLVKLQIRLAAGEPMPIKQSEVVQRGHA
ncbi:MAG: ATP-grasp domain-containing protein, partial [Candidatus Methylomirabilis sp.]|nr:ATP-grasp domain-containing protein [Deltaproteobacteria bacterium]